MPCSAPAKPAARENRLHCRRTPNRRLRSQPRRRFSLECLESRDLLSITVTTASDAVSHTGASLRDAIAAANAAAAGGASEQILFDSSLAGATITLAQGELELSGAGGGMIAIDGSSLSTPVTVSGNNVTRVFHVDSGVQAEIVGLTITAGQYTGYYGSGGGIYNEGTLSLSGDAIENNYNSGIFSTGALSVSQTTIQGNSGGGLTNYPGGQALVTNSVITGNSVGSGIINYGTMTVSDTTISANSSPSLLNGGGGINNQNTITVWRSTISYNTASKYGGGVYNGRFLSLIDSTLYGNSAGNGGGIYNGDNYIPISVAAGAVPSLNVVPAVSGTLQTTVSSSTLYDNSATGTAGNPTGGVYIGNGSLVLINSIVTDNSPQELDGAPEPNSSHNIIGNYAGLGPLADNGGPTQTMALLSGSPAIGGGGATTALAAPISSGATTISVAAGDAIARTPGSYLIQIDNEIMLVTAASGNALTVTRGYNGTTAASHSASAAVYLVTDQRGSPRVVDGSTDIGAFQTQGSPNRLYVQAVYLDVLGRPADAVGLAYWTYQLDHGRPRGDVAFDLVHSDEYYINIIITPAYHNYLLRDPEPIGLAYWNDQMKNHGLTDERLEAGFIGSEEFYQVRGGGTDPGWVDALYQAFLGRSADDAGKAYWVQQLAAGESRSEVAYGFAASLERERARITDDYMHYLGRVPDQQGIDYWVEQFKNGMTNENVITGFVASDEYYNKHSS